MQFFSLFIISFIELYRFYCLKWHLSNRFCRALINGLWITIPNDKGHFSISAEVWKGYFFSIATKNIFGDCGYRISCSKVQESMHWENFTKKVVRYYFPNYKTQVFNSWKNQILFFSFVTKAMRVCTYFSWSSPHK